MNKLVLTAFFACWLSVSGIAQLQTIVPEPVSSLMPRIAAKYAITPFSVISTSAKTLDNSAAFLNIYLQQTAGFQLGINKPNKPADIRLQITKTGKAVAGTYSLQINNKGITIIGEDETGVFYGVQSLLQLLPVVKTDQSLPLSYIRITDYPRFAYRGLMLDVSRHFFDIVFVKKYIDYIALHKLNYLHWHLTDDQGWRIEIKKYPKLTEVGAFRNGTIVGAYPGKENDQQRYGGFYTQQQIKEIVSYAQQRYVTIIPEIEMPGHASAAIAAYPQLSCFPDEATKTFYWNKAGPWAGDTTGKKVQQSWGVYNDVFAPTEYTFTFLQDVLGEVMSLFPGKYIHVGGDECPKTNWEKSAFCQQLIKAKGLKDEHGLQSYFIQRMQQFISSKGKTLIGWDEILEGGLAPNAVVMSWRGEEGGIAAATENHPAIMTPYQYVYFDYAQSKKEAEATNFPYLPVEKVYEYEPLPAKLPVGKQVYILGAQANLWTEYISSTDRVEYMLFPRLAALSEVLWSPKTKHNLNYFQQKMPALLAHYQQWGIHYYTPTSE
jgi:hexosaminidase